MWQNILDFLNIHIKNYENHDLGCLQIPPHASISKQFHYIIIDPFYFKLFTNLESYEFHVHIANPMVLKVASILTISL